MTPQELAIDACNRIETHAVALASAYSDALAAVKDLTRAAYQAGGERAADDVAVAVGDARLSDDLAVFLVGLGFADVMRRASNGSALLSTFAAPWVQRFQNLTYRTP